MALYAIGDIQGCDDEFARLLDRLKFDPGNDRLFLVGDLVNRGPDSANVIRRVMALGNAVKVVLGNHDLNALAVAAGVRNDRPKDTISGLIEAKDSDKLLDWLKAQPLLIEHGDYVFCHAGIYPGWRLKQARQGAREVEAVLQGKHVKEFLANMYGSEPDIWHDDLNGWQRLRFITNAFTRMRFVSRKGRLDHHHAGPPGSQPESLYPWFSCPSRKVIEQTIVFGHWSALGIYKKHGVIGLDTGCVWGNRLTAVRLDTPSVSFHSTRCST